MKKMLSTYNLLAFLLSVVMFLLAFGNQLPVNFDEVRESRAILFALPNGIANLTWLLFFVAMASFVIYQIRSNQSEISEKVSYYFIFFNIGLSTWLILFSYTWLSSITWLSSLAILMALSALLNIYLRLGIGIYSVSRVHYYAVNLPISFGMAWLSALSIRNIAVSVYDLNYIGSFWGITADIWAFIMIAFMTVLGLSLLFLRHDLVFAVVLAWVAISIFINDFSAQVFNTVQASGFDLVKLAAILSFAILATAVVVKTILKQRSKQKRQSFVPQGA